jgi:hypothetical protein
MNFTKTRDLKSEECVKYTENIQSTATQVAQEQTSHITTAKHYTNTVSERNTKME